MIRFSRRERLVIAACAALLCLTATYVAECRRGHAVAAASHAATSAAAAAAERDVVEGALYICGVVDGCDLAAQSTFTDCSGIPYIRREINFKFQWDAEGLITAQQDAEGNDCYP